jgi:ABC-type ATPase involved in cell division
MGGLGRSQHGRAVVGRETELTALWKHVQAGDIVYIHGLAGMGKSALLNRFIQQARASEASVVILDCRAVEPTQRGFLLAAAASTI